MKTISATRFGKLGLRQLLMGVAMAAFGKSVTSIDGPKPYRIPRLGYYGGPSRLSRNRYSGKDLRAIRAEKGIGRPPHVNLARGVCR